MERVIASLLLTTNSSIAIRVRDRMSCTANGSDRVTVIRPRT